MTEEVGQLVLPWQWVCPETLGKALNTTSFSEKRALLILFAHRSPNTWRYSNITYTHIHSLRHTHTYTHLCEYVYTGNRVFGISLCMLF